MFKFVSDFQDHFVDYLSLIQLCLFSRSLSFCALWSLWHRLSQAFWLQLHTVHHYWLRHQLLLPTVHKLLPAITMLLRSQLPSQLQPSLHQQSQHQLWHQLHWPTPAHLSAHTWVPTQLVWDWHRHTPLTHHTRHTRLTWVLQHHLFCRATSGS